MRLSDEAHERVEQFFREHRRDPDLVLPPVFVHPSLFAGVLMRFAGMGAITFGRHVFVTPSLVERDEKGRARLPALLLVHEATHVLQFEERGFARFLRDYLRGYWSALRSGGRWDALGRTAAYFSIEEEREARAAESAFASFGRTSSGGEKESFPRGSAGKARLTPFRESKN